MLLWPALLLAWRASALNPDQVYLLTPLAQFGEHCGYNGCPITKDGHLNVHIVPHSHAELGRTRSFADHLSGRRFFQNITFTPSDMNMMQILDGTISELWAQHERKFTISDSELPFFFYWWSKREGTVRRMVYELIRQSRLVFVGGGWGMHDEATTYYQAIIDSYTYSLRKINATFLTCGQPLVAWQADVFGHSREYASLVAQMGFDALFINPMSYDDEIIRMQRQALEFIWRGSDDLGSVSDIFTHKLFDGYWSPPGFCFDLLCSDPLMVHSDSVFKNIDERVDAFIESVRHRQAPNYNTSHIMVMMGTRFAYFAPALWFGNIDKLIQEVNRKTSRDRMYIYVIYSTPACYLKSVHYDQPFLETKQDDIFPLAYDQNTYLTGIFINRPAFKRLVRETNVYLQMMKQLQVLFNLGDNDALLEKFMWLVGVIQDHNIITGSMRGEVVQYYAEKMHRTVEGSIDILRQALSSLGHPPYGNYSRCPLNESSCAHTSGQNFYIIIYNPLAWEVRTPVRLPAFKQMYRVFGPKGVEVRAVLMPIPEPVLRMSNGKTHELVFHADLPALGLKSFYIQGNKKRMRRHLDIHRTSEKWRADRSMLINDDAVDFTELRPTTSRGAADEADSGVHAQPTTTVDIDTTHHSDSMETEDREIDTKAKENNRRENKTGGKSTERNSTEGKEHRREGKGNEKNENIHRNDENRKQKENMSTHNFYYEKSNDTFIRNQYIQINLDSYRKVTSIQLSNGLSTSLDIQYYYYVSDDPENLNETRKVPGTYVFRPIDNIPVAIIDVIDTEVFKSDDVEEIHTKYSDYVSFSIRLYKDSPVVELNWVLGAIPAEDDLGKELYVRYTTDLENNGVFYTDANGRQTIKRIKDTRALYEPENIDKIVGNMYPVTTRIYIEDLKKNMRLSIFNDRPQAGLSIAEGTIDMFLERRIFTDGSRNLLWLNGTDDDVLRGTHYLYLTKANFKPNRLFEKKFAKELELPGQIFIAKEQMRKEKWMKIYNEFSSIKKKLPFGVHVLTIQEWNAKTMLLRLENYLEKVDVAKDGLRRVNVKDLFHYIEIKKLRETTLAGNVWINDWVPLQWRLKEKFLKNFNDYYGTGNISFCEDEDLKSIADINLDEGVLLTPQQIRTFVVWYNYK